MVLHYLKVTEAWFKKLNRAQGNLVMLDRMNEREHRKARGKYGSPRKWWDTKNWVQKSIIYDKFITLKEKNKRKTNKHHDPTINNSRGEINDD